MNSYKKEDYRLQVTVRSGKLLVKNVPCRIYLPGKITDPISLEFHLDEKKGSSLLGLFDGAIQGKLKDTSGDVRSQIHATKVYFSNKKKQMWGDGSEITMTGIPRDLTITTLLKKGKNHNREHPITGSFWITPSEMLSPDQNIHLSYTGEVNVETLERKQFTLPNDISLSFNKHFRHVTDDYNDLITFSELVAEYEITGTAKNHDRIILDSLTYLDDFLLLVSFAARQPCICLGWEQSNAIKWTKHYRRDRIVPPIVEAANQNQALIDVSRFEDFFPPAYRHFMDFEPREFLRRALGNLVFQYGRNISEGSFLTLYSAFETLILWFRGKSNLEKILPDSEWSQFQKNFKKWIKADPSFSQSSERRKLFYENLRGMNRISLSTAFAKFCSDFSIYTQDLWPAFENEGGPSLSRIRNKLIHGVPLDPQQIKFLIPAYVHLRTLVERSILAILQWPIEESSVYTGATDEYGGRSWKEARESLKQAFIDFPELSGP